MARTVVGILCLACSLQASQLDTQADCCARLPVDSFGAAPAHFGLQDFWSVLIDPPVLMEVMAAIFGTRDFVTNSGSGGGDYNIP